MPSEWVEIEPTRVVLSKADAVEEPGGIAMPGEFLDCVLSIEGKEDQWICDLQADGRDVGLGIIQIDSDPYLIVLTKWWIHPFGDKIPRFRVRFA